MNLVKTIKDLENEKILIEKKYKNEIEEVESVIDYLRSKNTVCERCGGTGEVKEPVILKESGLMLANVETGICYDYITCDVCNGTGIKKID